MAVSVLATLVGVSICVLVGVHWAVKRKRKSKIPQTHVVTNSTSANQASPSTAETSFSTPSNEYFSLPSITANNTNYGESLSSNCPTVAGYAAEVNSLTL